MWRFLTGCVLLATLTGCPGPLEKEKPLPLATAGVEAVSSSVGSATAHIESAAKNAGTAHAEVLTAIPLTAEPATGHLTTADKALTTTESELKAALSDLSATKAELKNVKSALDAATKERVTAEKALSEATADAAKYREKYDSQWFAGKFWRMVWVVGIGSAIVAIIAIILNIKTNLFVLPFQQIGGWLWDIVAGTAKALWNVLVGIWNEISSLWRKTP